MTLLELIVVIVILGILAAIAIPVFLAVIQKSQDALALNTLEELSHQAYVDATASQAATQTVGYDNAALDTSAASTSVTASAAAATAAQQKFTIYITGGTPTQPAPSTVYGAVSAGFVTTDSTLTGQAPPAPGLNTAMKSASGHCVELTTTNGTITHTQVITDSSATCAAVGYAAPVYGSPPPTTPTTTTGGDTTTSVTCTPGVNCPRSLTPPPAALASTSVCNGNGVTPSGYATGSTYPNALSTLPGTPLLDNYAMADYPNGALDDTGTTTNSGTFGHTGTTSPQTGYDPGPFGTSGPHSANFPGGSDFFSLNPAAIPSATLTLSAWLGVSPQSNLVIANNFDSATQTFTGTPTYSLEDNANQGVLTAAITTTTGTTTLTVPTSSLPAPAANANAWHFLSVTYDGAHLTLYVDGVSAGTVSAGGTLVNATSGNHFGIKNVGTNTTTGYADTWVSQVSVSSSAISSDNEAALWTAGASADPGSALVVYRTVGEGTEALSAVGSTSISAPIGSVASITFHAQCDLSGGGSYQLANQPITWVGLTGTGTGTTTPQSFVNAVSSNPANLSPNPDWPPTTIPSDSTYLTASYLTYTDSSGNATAYPTTPPTPGDWRVCTQQDAAGNCAVTYDVTGTPTFGSTWTLTSTLTTGVAHGLSCSDATHCVMVGESVDGVGALYSIDGGVTWAASASPAVTSVILLGVSCAQGSSPDTTTCVAYGDTAPYPSGTNTGLYYSHDDGVTWAEAINPEGSDNWFYGSNAVSCNSDSHCVAVGDGTGGAPLYSTDGGATWTPSAALPTPNGPYNLLAVACASDTHCITTGQAGSSSQIAQQWVSDGGTDDAGASWTLSTTSGTWGTSAGRYTEGNGRVVTCADTTHCVVAGDWDGNTPYVAFSSDGGYTWADATPWPLNAPYGSGYRDGIQGLACNSLGHCVATTGNFHVWTSADFGAHWALVNISAAWPGIAPGPLTCPTANVCKSTASDLAYPGIAVYTAISP
jgi:Tfp pilus assembly protein PilE